jgi:hypothetical protein
MKEIKAYVINDEQLDLYETSVYDLTDDEFMRLAEESGSVYSLSEFEKIYNANESEELNPDYHFIRFIAVYKGE